MRAALIALSVLCAGAAAGCGSAPHTMTTTTATVQRATAPPRSVGLHVAVVEDGTAHLQKITITRDFGTEVEVHDGVKPGDQVILNPMVNLAEGSRVAVRKTQTS